MTDLAYPATAPLPTTVRAPLRCAEAALFLGVAAALGLAAIGLFVTTSSGDGAFHHAGDYWQTGDGIGYMLALLVLLPALRALQGRRDGRTGAAGIALAGAGAVVLVGMFVYGLIAATGSSLGPTYLIAALATVVGVAVFAIGSWRAGLLPRRLLAVWVVAWLVGSALPILAPGPLLLAAVYVVMAVLLPRRVTRQR